MQLIPSQEAAVESLVSAVNSGTRLVSLAGPAGTGKTTTMKVLHSELVGDPGDPECVVVTPTNKAAQVLRWKGVPADTLYSIFFTPVEEADGRLSFKPNHTLLEVPEGKLRYCPTIVVDESSMLVQWAIRQLQMMCKTLILVGDHHQLPPVGDKACPEGYFVTRQHDIELTEVLRQADGSVILELATHIRNGSFPADLIRSISPRRAFSETYDGSQKIIAFTNNHRRLINQVARRILGRRSVLPVPGDVLVANSTVNDWIFNGTEVTVESFSWDAAKRSPVAGLDVVGVDGRKAPGLLLDMHLFLEDQAPGGVPPAVLAAVESNKRAAQAKHDWPGAGSFSYGNCITAHKAQGSEYPSVIVMDERPVLSRVANGTDMPRRWLYTAFTRASENLIFAPKNWFDAAAKIAA